MPDGPLLLLDTASLYFRAYFGVPKTLTSPAGHPVNAVRGMLDIVAKFVTERRPSGLAACWDNDWRPDWRVALVPTYKAHRVDGGAGPAPVDAPIGAGGIGAASGVLETADEDLRRQVPWIAATLEAIGIATVGADGFEADDVIGTLATSATGPVEIVTGDRDLFQLVGDEVRVLYVARGISKYEVVDDDWLRAKYGITGTQYADFSVLRGDASDGLPGVSGIGEKTAASLLRTYGTLDDALADDGSARGKLAAAADYLAAARRVVAVRRDLPVGELDFSIPTTPADPERFVALVDELDLGGSANRLLAALASR